MVALENNAAKEISQREKMDFRRRPLIVELAQLVIDVARVVEDVVRLVDRFRSRR